MAPAGNCGVTVKVLTVKENELEAPLNCAVYWYDPGVSGAVPAV